jgi:hypothetical protein
MNDPKKPPKTNLPNTSAWTTPVPETLTKTTKPIKPDPFWRPKSRKSR